MAGYKVLFAEGLRGGVWGLRVWKGGFDVVRANLMLCCEGCECCEHSNLDCNCVVGLGGWRMLSESPPFCAKFSTSLALGIPVIDCLYG